MLNHLQNALHESGEVGHLPRAVAHAAEFQELLSDLLAAKRFLLDHADITLDQRYVRMPRMFGEHIFESAFERLAAKADAGQRVVDLMGDASSEEAYAGEAFAADELLAALGNLTFEVAVSFL